jgi:hypothetical protein
MQRGTLRFACHCDAHFEYSARTVGMLADLALSYWVRECKSETLR